MTPIEAAALCRYAKAACPQQAIDEYTPDAWADLLEDVRFDDAKLALRAVTRRQPFVAPAEIIAEVKRIRHERINAYGPIPAPPPELTDAQYSGYMRDMIRRIADGDLVREAPEPEVVEGQAERLGELLEGAFQEVPDE